MRLLIAAIGRPISGNRSRREMGDRVTMKPRVRRQLIAGGLVAGALAVAAPAVVSGHSSPAPAGVHQLPPPLPDPGGGSGKPSSSPEPSPTPGGGGPGGGGGGGGGGGYVIR